MSDNNKERVVLRVTLEDNKLKVVFGNGNHALLSHALRIASLELDNMIMAQEMKGEETLVKPAGFGGINGLMDRLK